MKYGYLRVSTVDKQQFIRQEYILQDYNLDRVFEEKISGTKKACGREEFNKLLDILQVGDEVYFESMSRMARSMQDLIDTTNYLVKEKKVKIIFVKENLTVGGDSSLDAMSALVFHIMAAFAQFERDLIADRTKTALAAKKAEGKILGRPRQVDDTTRKTILSLSANGFKGKEIALKLNISAPTVSRVLKESKVC